MIYEDVSELTRQAHKKIDCECDFHISPKCTGRHLKSYRDYVDVTDHNDGKYICIYCSRQLKSSGRYNPNTRYRKVDDDYFFEIDTEFKAYLLGWIASDGNISTAGIRLHIHQKDIEILEKINYVLGWDLSISTTSNNQVVWQIYSNKISSDCAKHLGCSVSGPKARLIKFPVLASSNLTSAFLRGFFDGDGSVIDPRVNTHSLSPKCSISSIAHEFLESIRDFVGLPCYLGKSSIEWQGNNALDLLGKLYNDASIYLERKFELYQLWSAWEVSISGYGAGGELFPGFHWAKTRKDAVPPFKVRVSDSGYDITLLEKINEVGNVQIYETGIKVQPDFGYYFILAPRSSIIKYPYIFANSFGVIDRTYTGTLKVALLKVDPKAPDLELPCKLAQIIPLRAINLVASEVPVAVFDKTARGDGGFGSTGNIEDSSSTGGIVTQYKQATLISPVIDIK